MSYLVKISEKADRDLRSIFEYIAFELQSMINATAQLDRLDNEINSLSEMPHRFSQYAKEPWHNRGLRMMPVDNYCVFYIPYDDTIEIIRVLYGGRNIDKILMKYARETDDG